MLLDSEDQREKLIAVIEAVRIEGTLAEVEHISAGMRSLFNQVKAAGIDKPEKE
jgi:hypothetical protein